MLKGSRRDVYASESAVSVLLCTGSVRLNVDLHDRLHSTWGSALYKRADYSDANLATYVTADHASDHSGSDIAAYDSISYH